MLQQAGVSAVVAASVVAFAGACGVLGMNDPDPLACFEGVDADVVVGGGNFMDTWLWSPNPVSISLGQSVCWVNVDGTDHTVTPTAGGSAFGGSLTAQSPYLVHTFTEAGDHEYFCDVHPEMVGLVRVAP